MSNLVLGAGSSKPYTIKNSILFNGVSDYLYRNTFGAGDRGTYTISVWIKRSELEVLETTGIHHTIFEGGYDTTPTAYRSTLRFTDADNFSYSNYLGSLQADLVTAGQEERDTSAWTHYCCIYDDSLATEADRVQLYINGVRQTFLGSTDYPAQNGDVSHIGFGQRETIGANTLATKTEFFEGYMAEFIFLDGQNVSVDNFGEFHPDNDKIWRPINPANTLTFTGNNTFWLDFQDDTSTTTLGYDVSGNGNHWTLSGLTTTDRKSDTPTRNCSTFSVLEPENTRWGIADGNLNAKKTADNGAWHSVRGDQFHNTGKVYFEMQIGNIGGGIHYTRYGFCTEDADLDSHLGQTNSWCINNASTGVWNAYSGTDNHTITGWTTDLVNWRILQCCIDFDEGKAWFQGGGTGWDGDPAAGTGATFTNLPTDGTGLTFAFASYDTTAQVQFQTGGRFWYSGPAGFTAWSTNIMPAPSIKNSQKYFDVNLYTGNATNGHVISTENRVDGLILKSATTTGNWGIFDDQRGVTKTLILNGNNIEAIYSPTPVTSVGSSSGFTLSNYDDTVDMHFNENTTTYGSYAFTEDSKAGFDIVTYTGTGVNRTVSHSLGVEPELMIVKRRSFATGSWSGYSKKLGNGVWWCPDTAAIPATETAMWNNTSPTSSVFTVGTHAQVNTDTITYAAWLWASVDGFCKVIDWVGNGDADGPFVYTGFKPRAIWLIRADVAGATASRIMDTERDPINVMSQAYFVSLNSASTGNISYHVDSLSNGFKIRNTHGGFNTSANQYIGIAWAEYPFALLNNSEL